MPIVLGKFFAAGDRRVGFYTLLLAAGHVWEPAAEVQLPGGAKIRLDPEKDFPSSPLAHYVGQQLVLNRLGTNKDAAEFPKLQQWGGGFVLRLGVFRGLVNRWTSGRADNAGDEQRHKEFWEAMDFADTSPDPYFAWATVAVVRNHFTNDSQAARKMTRVMERLQDLPGLRLEARFEYANLLCASAEWDKGRKVYADLFREAVAAGFLPPEDAAMHGAFTGGEPAQSAEGRVQWAALMRDAAGSFVARGDRSAVVGLARRCRADGDIALAADLLDLALDGAAGTERFVTTLAVVHALADANQSERRGIHPPPAAGRRDDRPVPRAVADRRRPRRPAGAGEGADTLRARARPRIPPRHRRPRHARPRGPPRRVHPTPVRLREAGRHRFGRRRLRRRKTPSRRSFARPTAGARSTPSPPPPAGRPPARCKGWARRSWRGST